MAITFRKLIQSIKDYKDQLASVMPIAHGAENPAWGIEDIWFKDGVLMLGQTDDQGDPCSLIVEKIERCVPEGLLDKPAVVKIGVAGYGAAKGQIFDADGKPAQTRNVKSSEVEPCRNNDWFCKWVLKFV
jgi:hypothetical protein